MKSTNFYERIDKINLKKIELYNFIEQTNKYGVRVIKVSCMNIWECPNLNNSVSSLRINLYNYFYGFELLRELNFQLMWIVDNCSAFENSFYTDVFYKYVRHQDALYLKDTTDRCYDFAFEIVRKINFSQIRMDGDQLGITKIRDERPELLREVAKLDEITWV